MKRLLSFIVMIVGLGLVSNTAYSQGFGVEGGVNFANVNGDDFESNETRTGIMLGIFYQYPLSGTSFILQPEVLYEQKGLEFENGTTVIFNYISLNLLLAYYIATEGSIAPFIKLGPYLGVNTEAKQEFDDGEEEELDDVKNTDVGVILRAGVQVGQRFEVGARLSQGITKISDSDNNDSKNFVFGIFAGVTL